MYDCIRAYVCRVDACECTHGSRFIATPFNPTAHMLELKIHGSHLAVFICLFIVLRVWVLYALCEPVASPGLRELGLPMVVSHSVGTENQMQVLCKSHKCS